MSRLSAYRNSKAQTDDLQEQLDKMKTVYAKDERYWYLTTDKTLNGEATIRFLPKPIDEPAPFIRYYSHSFKGPTGQWYIENSLSTFGKPDPLLERNSFEWNHPDCTKEYQDNVLKKRSRSENYVLNVLVIKDNAKPENNGKVFLFRCGKQIFDKISAKIKPVYESDAPINVFDIDEGVDFLLRCKAKSKNRNYEDSKFVDRPSVLCGGDEDMIEEVLNQMYSLQAEIAPNKFKTYDELKKQVLEVLGPSEFSVEDNGESNSEAAAPTTTRRTAKEVASEDLPTFTEKNKPKDDNKEASSSDIKSVSGDPDDYYAKIKARMAARKAAAA